MKELFTKIMLGELPWEYMIGEELSNFTRERWFLILKHAHSLATAPTFFNIL